MGKNVHLTDYAQQAQDHLRGSIGMNEAITAARAAGIKDNLNPTSADNDLNIMQTVQDIRSSDIQIG